MISIAGVTLPDCAVWTNEQKYGLPSSACVTDTDGFVHTYTGAVCRDIDIYVPNVMNGLTREQTEILTELAKNLTQVALIMGEKATTAVFRYADNPLELAPVSRKQSYDGGEIFYGTIRLTEV